MTERISCSKCREKTDEIFNSYCRPCLELFSLDPAKGGGDRTVVTTVDPNGNIESVDEYSAPEVGTPDYVRAWSCI